MIIMFQSNRSYQANAPEAPPRRNRGKSLSNSRSSLDQAGQSYDRDALAFNHYSGFLKQPLKRHLSSDIAYLVPSMPAPVVTAQYANPSANVIQISSDQSSNQSPHPVTSSLISGRPPTPANTDKPFSLGRSPFSSGHHYSASSSPPSTSAPSPLANQAIYAVPRKILKQKSLDSPTMKTMTTVTIDDFNRGLPPVPQRLSTSMSTLAAAAAPISINKSGAISISTEGLIGTILSQQTQLDKLSKQQEFLTNQLILSQEAVLEAKRSRSRGRSSRSRNSSECQSEKAKRSSSRERIQEQLHAQQSRVQQHIQQLQAQLELIRDIRSSSRPSSRATSVRRDANSVERATTMSPSIVDQDEASLESRNRFVSRTTSPPKSSSTKSGPTSPEIEFKSDQHQQQQRISQGSIEKVPRLILTNASQDSKDESDKMAVKENKVDIPYMDADEDEDEIETVLEMNRVGEEEDYAEDEDAWEDEIGFYSDYENGSPEVDFDHWSKLREEDIERAREEMDRQNAMLAEQEEAMREQRAEIAREREALKRDRFELEQIRATQTTNLPNSFEQQKHEQSQNQANYYKPPNTVSGLSPINVNSNSLANPASNVTNHSLTSNPSQAHLTSKMAQPPARPPPPQSPRTPSPIPFLAPTAMEEHINQTGLFNQSQVGNQFDFNGMRTQRSDQFSSLKPDYSGKSSQIPEKPARSTARVDRQLSTPVGPTLLSGHRPPNSLNSNLIKRPSFEEQSTDLTTNSSILRSKKIPAPLNLATTNLNSGFHSPPAAPPRRKSQTPRSMSPNRTRAVSPPSFRVPRSRSRTPEPNQFLNQPNQTKQTISQNWPLKSVFNSILSNQVAPMIRVLTGSSSDLNAPRFNERRDRSPSPLRAAVGSQSYHVSPREPMTASVSNPSSSLVPGSSEMSTLKIDAQSIRSNRPSRASSPAPNRRRSPSPKPAKRIFINKDTSEAGSFVDHFNHYYAPQSDGSRRPLSQNQVNLSTGDLNRSGRSVTPMRDRSEINNEFKRNGTLPNKLENHGTANALVDVPINYERRQTLPEIVKGLGIDEPSSSEEAFLRKVSAGKKKHSLPQDDLHEVPPVPGWEREKVSALAHEAREARMNQRKGPVVHLAATAQWLVKYRFLALIAFFNGFLAYIFIKLLDPVESQEQSNK